MCLFYGEKDQTELDKATSMLAVSRTECDRVQESPGGRQHGGNRIIRWPFKLVVQCYALSVRSYVTLAFV